jgi:hypothetical protein
MRNQPPPDHVPGTPYDGTQLARERGPEPVRGPKETAYDEKIAPLMAQIIALAKEAKINFTVTYFLDIDRARTDVPIQCRTTLLPDLDRKNEVDLIRGLVFMAGAW